MQVEKDFTIIDLVNWLRERLGDAFAITDHWEADFSAIGLSAPSDPKQLVYILTRGRPKNRYAAQLETSPPAGSDFLYNTVGKFESLSREELLAIIVKHLGISR